MSRMYEDDKEEADSIIAWTDRRLQISNNSYTVILFMNLFKDMWIKSFGTLDSVPPTFKEQVERQYNELKEKEKSDEI